MKTLVAAVFIALASTSAAHAVEVPRGRGERVLIVVERAGKLNMLYDTVTLNGYEATIAQSGTEALQKIASAPNQKVLWRSGNAWAFRF